MANGFEAWADFLYDQSDLPAQPLSRLPTAHWGSGTGQLSVRSAWTTDATYSNLICGPYTQSHAHRDQGSFVLFKGHWLAFDENIDSHSGLAQGESAHNLVRIEKGGAVVEQRRLALTAGMRIHHLRHHTTLLAADIVERVIGTLGHSSHIETTPQDASRGSYYSYIPPIRRALAIRRFNKHVRGLEASPRPAFRERRSGPQAW